LDKAFDALVKILSELPADKAMKELSQSGARMPAVRQLVETIALKKKTIIHSMQHIRFRERLAVVKMETGTEADRVIREWLKANPNFDIDLKPI